MKGHLTHRPQSKLLIDLILQHSANNLTLDVKDSRENYKIACKSPLAVLCSVKRSQVLYVDSQMSRV